MTSLVSRSLKRWGFLAFTALIIYAIGWTTGQIWREKQELAQAKMGQRSRMPAAEALPFSE